MGKTESTPYSKQKSSLEKELSRFLTQTTSDRDITTAIPDDVVNFLIWKDRTGKTVVHKKVVFMPVANLKFVVSAVPQAPGFRHSGLADREA